MEFNYIEALYRRNNFNQPCVWFARPSMNFKQIEVFHGTVGKKITKETINIVRLVDEEIKSRINAKRKAGYKFLNELKDNVELPVEGELINYLNTYLPYDRTDANGTLLPMLAKTYDNTNNKLFKKVSYFLGQYKINGLRCFITAHRNSGELFKPVSLKFQSREGIVWKSLDDLEYYLLHVIPMDLIETMIETGMALDGELYLPGYDVNDINHFVKDPKAPQNKLLQFWCYDIGDFDANANTRGEILNKYLYRHCIIFEDEYQHLNNDNRLILLPTFTICNDDQAVNARDMFISMKFEGLILRDPNKEYQFGKRNSAMIKFKRSTDGKFIIKDIYPEVKRKNIPIFLLKNDINDSEFEVHLSASFEYQERILKYKNSYIGKYMYVEYGERSGVNSVPFHVKHTHILP